LTSVETSSQTTLRARRRIPLVLAANAIMRISGGATGVLVGLYLARSSRPEGTSSVALAGFLGAAAYGAELVGAIPLGLLADVFAAGRLMTAGALLSAGATQLFGLTGNPGVFFVSRLAEGLGAAAIAPALLAHLSDITAEDSTLRSRVMSFFELSLLAGLALGAVFAGALWKAIGTGAFSAVAAGYLAAGILLHFGAAGSKRGSAAVARTGLARAFRDPLLRSLAPVWLCVNSIVGLWLGPSLSFLLTRRSTSEQFLAGVFADDPQQVGWMMLGYAIIFGAGVTVWSFILPRVRLTAALRIALIGMLFACAGIFLLNHSRGLGGALRWTIGILTAISIMVESGFTPAALSMLAGAVGAQGGRGATMGIYSVLVSIGAVSGSLLAGWLGSWYLVDGLIFGTIAMALAALGLVFRLEREERVDS